VVSRDAAFRSAGPDSGRFRSPAAPLPSFAARSLYSVGDTPNRCLNALAKFWELEKPLSAAIEVMPVSGRVSIRFAASSIRSLRVNSPVVSPATALKTRWKWKGEKAATFAISSRERSRSILWLM